MDDAVAHRAVRLYGMGIEGCLRHSVPEVNSALMGLIASLEFDEGGVADGFYQLYEYCLRKVRERQFDKVAWILSDLRETWLRAAEEATSDLAVGAARAS